MRDVLNITQAQYSLCNEIPGISSFAVKNICKVSTTDKVFYILPKTIELLGKISLELKKHYNLFSGLQYTREGVVDITVLLPKPS